MKKIIISLVVLLCIAGVCIVTCPDRHAHKDTLMALVNNKINTMHNIIPPTSFRAYRTIQVNRHLDWIIALMTTIQAHRHQPFSVLTEITKISN